MFVRMCVYMFVLVHRLHTWLHNVFMVV